MQTKTYDYPLVIIGAGAAGIGASIRADELGMDHVLLEASHRIGGRGLTETLENGVVVDLGCHWMHCASVNPFVQMADTHGFHYEKGNMGYRAFVDGRWRQDGYMDTVFNEFDRIDRSMVERFDVASPASVWDYIDSDSQRNEWASYWYSLMHSNDPDQVSILDPVLFEDTLENWPLKQGYGALIEKVGKGIPVRLNSAVTAVKWSGGAVEISTQSGRISAQKVLITVSTGILAGSDIRFTPELPLWKQSAIADLPLGNYNNLFFPVRSGALKQMQGAIGYQRSEERAIVYIRPFDENYVFTVIAGRFAWWLEKQGERAAEQWFASVLMDIFGADIGDDLGKFKCSAWGFDPWVRGAYSSTRPGAGNVRQKLIHPVNDKLFFAGEAASIHTFNTAHGAWRSGQSAVESMFK